MTPQFSRKGFLWLLTVLVLTACESEKMQQTEFSIQQNYFMQSLELVESAGVKLQNPAIDKQGVDLAMQQMDEGLGRAFQVERKFLRKLDVRLPRFYTELFIAGVEKYRLGVESSNRQQQLEGLELLSRWGEFWSQEKSQVQQKLVSLNG